MFSFLLGAGASNYMEHLNYSLFVFVMYCRYDIWYMFSSFSPHLFSIADSMGLAIKAGFCSRFHPVQGQFFFDTSLWVRSLQRCLYFFWEGGCHWMDGDCFGVWWSAMCAPVCVLPDSRLGCRWHSVWALDSAGTLAQTVGRAGMVNGHAWTCKLAFQWRA